MPPPRILLVDDSDTFLGTLQRFLQRHAFEVVGTAGDGLAAIQAAAQLHPDLIVMDIAMPRMNGLEATRLLKAQAKTPCVIILTLHDLPEYRAEAERAGADGWVTKKSLNIELLAAIDSLFWKPETDRAEGEALT